MSALAQVSSRTLAAAQAQGSGFMQGPAASAGGAAPPSGLGSSAAAGAVKLPALSRMVEVLLFNLPRIQVFFWVLVEIQRGVVVMVMTVLPAQ
jgi:hypothetical protein